MLVPWKRKKRKPRESVSSYRAELRQKKNGFANYPAFNLFSMVDYEFCVTHTHPKPLTYDYNTTNFGNSRLMTDTVRKRNINTLMVDSCPPQRP